MKSQLARTLQKRKRKVKLWSRGQIIKLRKGPLYISRMENEDFLGHLYPSQNRVPSLIPLKVSILFQGPCLAKLHCLVGRFYAGL